MIRKLTNFQNIQLVWLMRSTRLLLPAMSHDEAEADQLAASHLDGPHHRATIRAVALCGLRRIVQSVKPWRMEDVFGKPLGRRV